MVLKRSRSLFLSFLAFLLFCICVGAYANEKESKNGTEKSLADTLIYIAQKMSHRHSYKLQKIAMTMVKLGYSAKALEIIKKDQSVYVDRPNLVGLQKSKTYFSDIIEVILQEGKNISKTLEIAQKIAEETPQKTLNLGAVARAMVKTNNISEALEIAQKIINEESRYPHAQVEVLCPIIVSMIEAGNKKKAKQLLAEALKLAKKIKRNNLKGEAFQDITIVSARLGGKIEKNYAFIKAIETIQGKYDEIRFLNKIAKALALAGSVAESENIFKRAMKNALKLRAPYSSTLTKIQALGEIMIAINDAKNTNIVNEVSMKLYELINKIEKPSLKTPAFGEVVKILVKVRNISKALEVADEMQEAYYKACALETIAPVMAELGDIVKAKEILNKAFKLVQETNEDKTGAKIRSIVKTMVQIGGFDEALEMVKKITDINLKSKVFKDVAIAIAKAGNISRALELTEKIKYTDIKVESLEAIVVALINAGEVVKAEEILAKALDLTHKVEPPAFVSSDVFTKLAKAKAEKGKFTEALKITQKIDEPYKNEAIKDIAIIMAKAGNFKEAVKLFQKLAKDKKIEALANIALVGLEAKLSPSDEQALVQSILKVLE